jgi:hypothetical protein
VLFILDKLKLYLNKSFTRLFIGSKDDSKEIKEGISRENKI